jgi:hypothetical protein
MSATISIGGRGLACPLMLSVFEKNRKPGSADIFLRGRRDVDMADSGWMAVFG